MKGSLTVGRDPFFQGESRMIVQVSFNSGEISFGEGLIEAVWILKIVRLEVCAQIFV